MKAFAAPRSLLSLLALAVVALGFGAFAPPARAQSYTFGDLISSGRVGGIAFDREGNIYFTDTVSHTVVKIPPAGAPLTLAGSGTAGSQDGTGRAAGFNSPCGLGVDSGGNIYVADSANCTIRKITPAGVVTTVAGSARVYGSSDGPGNVARFALPTGLAVDTSDNIFVTDLLSSTIRKIAPSGVVSTFGGNQTGSSLVDGVGIAAHFSGPTGLAFDAAGNLFVADSFSHTIRKISPAAVVTTFAGATDRAGFADGVGSEALFYRPTDLAFDAAGNLFVTDNGNLAVRKITPAGVVTTLAGAPFVDSATSSWYLAGLGGLVRFVSPRTIAVAPSGTLIVGDSYGIARGVPGPQLSFTVQPTSASVAAGAAFSLNSTATGSAPISYQWSKNGTPLVGATLSSLAFRGLQSADAATYTVAATNSTGTAHSTNAVLRVLPALTNDNFADAQIIAGESGTTRGHNRGATGEPGEPTHYWPPITASSVWYRWTAERNGTAIFDLQGLPILAALAAYTGSTVSALHPVALGSGTRLTFTALAGTTYSIALGTYYESDRGDFTLTWFTLANDQLANAQLLTGNSGAVRSANDGATAEPGEQRATSLGANSVWFQWTPTISGAGLIDVPPGWDVRSFTGTTFATLAFAGTWQAFNVTNAGVTSWRLHFNVIAGTTYRLAVTYNGLPPGPFTLGWQVSALPIFGTRPGDETIPPGASVSLRANVFAGPNATYQWLRDSTPVPGATASTFVLSSAQLSDTGSYTVRVSDGTESATSSPTKVTVVAPPANDNFLDAVSLSGLSGTIAGTNVNATPEPDEPYHWNQAGFITSVWYDWTPPASGLATVDTIGSALDTVLAVYTGTELATLRRLKQDDDSGDNHASLVSFSVTAGTTYRIAVAGAYYSARNTFRLNWRLSATLAIATPPANQTVGIGGTATFSVSAVGSGVTYQWNRNGTAIPGATNSSLTLTAVAGESDAGYTVTIQNSTGTITSSPATLAVVAPALTTLALRHTQPGSGQLWSIAAGRDTLVAVGDNGAILSSTDEGRSWSPRTSGTTFWLVGITYGAGRFVAVGDHGLILLSPDGSTWVPAADSATTQRLNNVLFAADQFVAVGEGGTIVTSFDGHLWTPRLAGAAGSPWLRGLAYHPGTQTFAASGQGGVFLHSTDAVTWSRLPIAGVTADLEAVTAVDSYAHFVAVGQDGLAVSVRRNEAVLKSGEPVVTWSGEPHSTGSTVRFRGLAQGASALFATGEAGQVVTATSDTGPWFTLPTATTANLLSGLSYRDKLYIVGEDQTILQSAPLYTSRLVNLSTRGQVATGADVMISGFVVTGTRPKSVLVRAVGPTLATFGVTGSLAAPSLKIVDAQASVLSANTGWFTATNAGAIATTAARVGAFPFSVDRADSAALLTLPPGAYTAHVSAASGTGGVALVEAYDADPLSNETSHAINLSTRGFVGTEAGKLIAGFVIEGASARRVLIRAVGPTLGTFGVAGALAQPQLELYTARSLLHSASGEWGLQPNADEIRAAFGATGAFKLADGSKDSAMLVTLLPGAWTVQVSGANQTTGTALVEVYEVP